MKKIFTAGIVATMISLFASNAMAQSRDLFYIGASGNVAFKKNSKLKVGDSSSGKIDYGFNSGATLALGINATEDLRLELEGGYHAFGMKKVTSGSSVNNNPRADLKMMTVMGNAFYDFHNYTSFTPYIGVGAGEAFVKLPSEFFNTKKSSDNKAAYQLMAGVSYAAASMPSVNWLLGYRYINVAAPQFAIDQSATNSNVKFGRIGFSNVELGMRYNF